MPQTQKPVRRKQSRGGRPTREQAQRRHQELLDEALEQFLEKGFVMTTIEMIATAVSMTKRTVYARYPDKNALFLAAVQCAIERGVVQVDDLSRLDINDLEGTLLAIARIRMQAVSSPDGLRLQRILAAESYRFPQIYTLAYDQGMVPTVRFLTRLLRHHMKAGAIRVVDAEAAAGAFLSMVLGVPSRGHVWGESVDEKLLRDQRLQFCVQLFLNGARADPPASRRSRKT